MAALTEAVEQPTAGYFRIRCGQESASTAGEDAAFVETVIFVCCHRSE
jgi:hypothetical protein